MKTTKKFTFGKIAYSGSRKTNLVEVEMSLSYKVDDKLPAFTASAAVWDPKHYGYKMAGQCLDIIYEDHSKELENLPLYLKILGLWERNHLNDLNAGTPEQMEELERWGAQGNKYDYTAACEHLKSVGLYEVVFNGQPFKYGHGWIYREISPEDLKEIKELLEVN